ncbi:hypothetical protein KP509_30G049200 [Ceratopteris richardii]|nr:hypothetical protein KP509_30G049200 [Ceratopteris richardii]
MVNAALGGQLFVGVGGHKLTVVEVDATYVKPVEVDHFLLQPGQTSSVLLKAGQTQGNFYLAARPFIAPNVSTDNTTATAIITYVTASGDPVSSSSSAPLMPSLPAFNDTSDAARFSQSLRSLASPEFPVNVPLQVDRHLFFTVGLGLLPCSSCPFNVTLAAAVNNISFVLPQTALLQAHYFNQSNVFTEDFPTAPQNMIDFTGQPPANPFTVRGTRVTKIPFNSTVQLVLQGTSLIGKENHPIHLHGFNFYVVGQGFGNYNNVTDPPSFNLVDPQERNTIGIPQGGWAAIRFRADNPGVWFMHCHLELHTMLGLDTAIVVDDGSTLDQSLIPPPLDLPPC